MKLNTRFFLSHGLVALVSLAVCLALLWGAARFVLGEETARLQRQKADALAMAAREAAISQDELSVLSVMREQLKDAGVVFAAWEPAGRAAVVLPSAAAGRLKALPATPGAVLAGIPDPVRVWTLEYSPASGTGGRVRLAFDQRLADQAVHERLQAWARPALFAALAALALGALASLLLARTLARPLRQISEGTRGVRAGKLETLVLVDRRDEIGDLARDFNAMTQQLRELDQMKRDFVSGVTHDLGTPLQAMRSASNYLLAGRAGKLSQGQSEYLLLMSNSLESLNAFIQNLLQAARIEAGKVDPYHEVFDAAKAIADWVKLYRAQAQEKGLVLEWENRAGDARIKADMVQFRQMFVNLLSNALKFTPKGTVRVELHSNNQWLILKVSDTGIGIDSKYHELVFDRFFRVRQPKGAPARQGSGLGLAIVKGLAEAHGGKVSLHSALGMGATLTLELPRRL